MSHENCSPLRHIPPKPVALNWEDPASSSGWEDSPTDIETAKVSSMGYLTAECPHYVYVCREFYEEDGGYKYADIGVYPRSIIRGLTKS